MLPKEKIEEIERKILEDLNSQLAVVKSEVNFFIDKDLNLYFLREFIKSYTPKLLEKKAEILLDTLLNYLMSALLEVIRDKDISVKQSVVQADIRERVKAWALGKNNAFNPTKLELKEDEEILERLKEVAPGLLVAIGGAAAAVIVSDNILTKLVPGLSTLAGSAYIIKQFRERVQRLKRIWKKNVENYLDINKKLLHSWLTSVIEKFHKEVANL
ncbi:MAG: hypothetical protein ACO2OY_03450 [Thermodesulfobacteriaceae bacterium]|jgi:hypothetical protein